MDDTNQDQPLLQGEAQQAEELPVISDRGRHALGGLMPHGYQHCITVAAGPGHFAHCYAAALLH